MSWVTPYPGVQLPDVIGFTEAMDRKRQLLGSTVTFFWPAQISYPPGTALALSGAPLDPTVVGSAASAPSASATAAVFFKAMNRGGAANSEKVEAIGHDEMTRLFVNLASADGLVVRGVAPPPGASGEAVEFVFHGDRFKILSIKQDEIVQGYVRTLVYGAGIGADNDSGFQP